MRSLFILVTVLVVCGVVGSSPTEPKHWLFNPPRDYEVYKRSTQVKGGQTGVKGYDPPMPALRKGEYICGNRVCKLKPGEIPAGCHGTCQYPL